MRRNKLLITVVAAVALTMAGLAPAVAARSDAGRHRSARAAAARAPVALKAVPVATGLNGPSGFTFGPGGKIWYLERGTGQIRIYTPSTDNDRLFEDITAVDGDGERGALGIALHPNYPATPYVYVYVTRTDQGDLVNEVLRIRSVNGHGGARRVLFKWSVSGATNHNGGRILFGPDGNLWVVTGDNGDPSDSQRRANLRGKVLRIQPDGGIPSGNPFGTRIYAFGIRNSFGLAFDPRTDRLWETENGPECNDEINLIRRGGNFSWGPNQDCPNTNRDGPAPRRQPKWNFDNTIGITGAAFCNRCGLGGGRNGDLFVGDVNTGSVRVLNLNAARTDFNRGPRTVLGLDGIHSMEVSANRRIYVSTATGIWRIARA